MSVRGKIVDALQRAAEKLVEKRSVCPTVKFLKMVAEVRTPRSYLTDDTLLASLRLMIVPAGTPFGIVSRDPEKRGFMLQVRVWKNDC